MPKTRQAPATTVQHGSLIPLGQEGGADVGVEFATTKRQPMVEAPDNGEVEESGKDTVAPKSAGRLERQLLTHENALHPAMLVQLGDFSFQVRPGHRVAG